MRAPASSLAECLLQAAAGPAAWVDTCHRSCKWQFRHNLASSPRPTQQTQSRAADTGCIAKFLIDNKDSEGQHHVSWGLGPGKGYKEPFVPSSRLLLPWGLWLCRAPEQGAHCAQGQQRGLFLWEMCRRRLLLHCKP